MKPDGLEKHILSTYLTLRFGIAVIAILFPALLYVGGKLYAGLPLQDSMSAYYHAAVDGHSMRNWFVGILFAVGAFLYLYKGYSNKENIALNFAGAFAVGIAIFPMEWNCGDHCAKVSPHGVSAVLFFISIAFVCLRCASDTLKFIDSETTRNRFRALYRSLGVALVLSPIGAFLITAVFQLQGSLTFFVEALGILAFSAYWIAKSREIRLSELERRATRGEVAL